MREEAARAVCHTSCHRTRSIPIANRAGDTEMAGIYVDIGNVGHNSALTEDVLYGLDGRDQLLTSEATLYAEGGRGNDFIGSLNPTGTVEIYGGQGNDQIFGRQGNDKLYGGVDDDWLVAAAANINPDGSITPQETSGVDYMEGGAGADALYGFDGNDELYGGGGDDKGTIQVPHVDTWFTDTYQPMKAGLYGGDGNDLVDGGGGDDLVSGGNGNDMLRGGNGADQFLFDTALSASSNVDRIADFSRGEGDKLLLSEAVFAEIGPSLAKNEFVLGNKAKDGNDHLVFNQKKGTIAYDEDGKGGAKAVVFATIEKGVTLAHTDFDMV
jgi:Ca2+-binding RTX toxin-like protein